jgi:hypothetical protein
LDGTYRKNVWATLPGVGDLLDRGGGVAVGAEQAEGLAPDGLAGLDLLALPIPRGASDACIG